MKKADKKLLCIILVICTLVSSLISANAAIIKEDNSTSAAEQTSVSSDYHCCSYYLNTNDNGNRMFSEWLSYITTAGIPRQSHISAYMKAGETAYFGSSVYESYLSMDGYAYSESTGKRFTTLSNKLPSEFVAKLKLYQDIHNEEVDSQGKRLGAVPTGCDIVVEDPTGVRTAYDVIKDGAGYIGKRKQEKNGADYLNTGNPNQYTPLSFVAQTEGVYNFYFHSKDGSGLNPEPKLASVDDTGYTQGYGPYNYDNNGNSITRDYTDHALNDFPGMWDITIVDTNALSNDGTTIAERKPGRVYAKYLAMNNGNNQIYSNIQLYVLTSDGIKYKVTMDRVDPYGFIFFANNRGLYTNDNNMTSIYHSVYAGVNDMSALYTTTNGCSVSFHSPMTVDTTLNKTYNLFFENPNDDLKHILYEDPSVPEINEDIKFTGYNDNHAYYKKGGYFTFKVKNASSLTLSIDVSAAIEENAATDDTAIRAEAQEYLDSGGSCKISLSGPVIDGENTFFWDGKDSNDMYVPIGNYNDKTIIYELIPKVGEIHFPLLDVEGMGKYDSSNKVMQGGFSIHQITKIYNKDNQEIDISDPDLVYFNNNPLAYGTIQGKDTEINNYSDYWYLLSDGTKSSISYTNSNTCGKKFFINSDMNAGEISPVSYFSPERDGTLTDTKKIMAFQQKAGDTSAIDTWTYCVVSDSIKRETKTDFVIDDEDEFHGSLKGRVFYDTDPDGMYKNTFDSGDFPLGGYTMVATCTQTSSDEVNIGDTFTAVTNSDGIYVFHDLPKGTYKVDFLDSALSGYQRTSYGCTTKNVNTISDSEHPNLTSIVHKIPNYSINETTCKEANNYILTANPIGMYVEKAQYSYTIHKTWGESVTSPLDSITVTLYAVKKGDDGKAETVGWVRKVNLTASSNWEYTVNNLSNEYLYYVVESYYDEDGNEIIIGGSDPIAPELQRNEEQFDGITDTIVTEQTDGSYFNADFEYSLNGANGRYINITNATSSYKVYFHMNLTNNEEDYFRVYYPRNSVYHYPSTQDTPDDFDPSELEPYDTSVLNVMKSDPVNEGKYDNNENVSGTQDNKYWLSDENKIDDFYSIPLKENNNALNLTPESPNGKVFLGWYYESNYNATGKPVKWNTDEYNITTHIYAHWYDTGLIQKDSNDEKVTGTDTYGGFDSFGVQIRNYLYDPNHDNGDPFYYEDTTDTLGLRFVTAISNDLLSTVNELYGDGVYDIKQDIYLEDKFNVESNCTVDSDNKKQNMSYGFVMCTGNTGRSFERVYNHTTLEYNSDNTNGVDTSVWYNRTVNNKVTKYVSNIECTSRDYNLQTNIIDHRNYSDYRIMSAVLKGNIDAYKDKEYLARAYLRYIDANGLIRTFYNDYTGNSRLLCGCCTCFSTVANALNTQFDNALAGVLDNEQETTNP